MSLRNQVIDAATDFAYRLLMKLRKEARPPKSITEERRRVEAAAVFAHRIGEACHKVGHTMVEMAEDLAAIEVKHEAERNQSVH